MVRICNLFRGALVLPFLFPVTLSGATSLASLYDGFYKTPEKYKSWAVRERNSVVKDLFLQRYKLPFADRKGLGHRIDLNVIPSKAKENRRYGYIYLQADRDVSFRMAVSGIRRGFLKVNGSEKGPLKAEGIMDYSLIDVALKKGVYFFSLTIEKGFEDVPVVIMSDKALKLSTERGFDRDARASVRISNHSSPYVGKSDPSLILFRKFCFPSVNDEGKEYGKMIAEGGKERASEAILFLLSKISEDPEARKRLKEIGFSDQSLTWWSEQFLKRRICDDE